MASISQIIGFIVLLPGLIWKIWRAIDKKLTALDKITTVLDERTVRIEKQFGDNGGGLREAVNTHGRLLEKIDSRTIETVEDLAILKGRFDQMVTQ
jgi:hypothetical protein